MQTYIANIHTYNKYWPLKFALHVPPPFTISSKEFTNFVCIYYYGWNINFREIFAVGTHGVYRALWMECTLLDSSSCYLNCLSIIRSVIICKSWQSVKYHMFMQLKYFETYASILKAGCHTSKERPIWIWIHRKKKMNFSSWHKIGIDLK